MSLNMSRLLRRLACLIFLYAAVYADIAISDATIDDSVEETDLHSDRFHAVSSIANAFHSASTLTSQMIIDKSEDMARYDRLYPHFNHSMTGKIFVSVSSDLSRFHSLVKNLMDGIISHEHCPFRVKVIVNIFNHTTSAAKFSSNNPSIIINNVAQEDGIHTISSIQYLVRKAQRDSVLISIDESRVTSYPLNLISHLVSVADATNYTTVIGFSGHNTSSLGLDVACGDSSQPCFPFNTAHAYGIDIVRLKSGTLFPIQLVSDPLLLHMRRYLGILSFSRDIIDGAVRRSCLVDVDYAISAALAAFGIPRQRINANSMSRSWLKSEAYNHYACARAIAWDVLEENRKSLYLKSAKALAFRTTVKLPKFLGPGPQNWISLLHINVSGRPLKPIPGAWRSICPFPLSLPAVEFDKNLEDVSPLKSKEGIFFFFVPLALPHDIFDVPKKQHNLKLQQLWSSILPFAPLPITSSGSDKTYFAELEKSLIAYWTFGHKGFSFWESLRPLELMFAGVVPYFLGLSPSSSTASSVDNHQRGRNNPSSSPGVEDGEKSQIPSYALPSSQIPLNLILETIKLIKPAHDLPVTIAESGIDPTALQCLYDVSGVLSNFARYNLSTIALAQRFLSAMNKPRAKSVLLLISQPLRDDLLPDANHNRKDGVWLTRHDYLSDGLLHGLRSLLADKAIDFPKHSALYRNPHDANNSHDYGVDNSRGPDFQYPFMLSDDSVPDINRHEEFVVDKIKNKYFDLIAFIHLDFPTYSQKRAVDPHHYFQRYFSAPLNAAIEERYSREDVALFDGLPRHSFAQRDFITAVSRIRNYPVFASGVNEFLIKGKSVGKALAKHRRKYQGFVSDIMQRNESLWASGDYSLPTPNSSVPTSSSTLSDNSNSTSPSIVNTKPNEKPFSPKSRNSLKIHSNGNRINRSDSGSSLNIDLSEMDLKSLVVD